MLGLVRFIIRLYQCTLSPLLRLLCGPDCGCRFTPTGSSYFLEAVETHGVRHGSWLGLKRLARCQRWGGGGYGPVPPRWAGGSQTEIRRCFYSCKTEVMDGTAGFVAALRVVLL